MNDESRQRKILSLFALLLCAQLLVARAQTDLDLEDDEPLPFEFSAKAIADYEALMDEENEIESDAEETRSFLCLPLLRIFSVTVGDELAAGRRVGLVGDHDRLGAWQVDRGVEMTLKRDGRTWKAKVPICSSRRMHYRYFIYSTDARGRRRVHEWEGVPYGRVMEKYQMYRPPGMDHFGYISDLRVADVERERGWLRHEYAIEFQFVWQHHIRFHRHLRMARHQRYWLKLSVYRNGGPVAADSLGDTQVEVSRYAYNQSQFRVQPRDGAAYAQGDIVLFRVVEPLKRNNSYHLTISTRKNHRVGEVIILSLDLRGTQGKLSLPIRSLANGFQVGQLRLPYVVIRPLQGSALFNMRSGFHRYWPLNWPTLDVGHRGAGRSFAAHAAQVENTIASYLHVLEKKADMIELNVHLTRDFVPVVWHDFGFKTAPARCDVQEEEDLADALIKDLTYSELKSSRVFMLNGSDFYEHTRHNVRSTTAAQRLFPTLREVFEALPLALGIHVEIKWPQLRQSGEIESKQQTLDKNRFVDAILQTTTEHGCGRPLVFSSFDADICSMVRYKQNAFGVVFLTVGETAEREPYKDLRTRSYLEAVNFAHSASLLGVAAHAGDFLEDLTLIDLGLDLGQALFLWGSVLNDPHVVQSFKEAHVSGLIYDQLDVNGPQRKRGVFFNATELIDMFKRQCIVTNHSNCTSGEAPEAGSHDGFCEPIIKKIG